MLRLFFDTEFTDFKDCDLISIGIVSELGHEFYGENAEFSRDWCNDFVKETVLPLLDKKESMKAYWDLKTDLQIWLSNLIDEHGDLECIFDFSGDWYLLGELLVDYPRKNQIIGRKMNLDAGVELFFMSDERNRMRHHALWDARALLNGWKVHQSSGTAN